VHIIHVVIYFLPTFSFGWRAPVELRAFVDVKDIASHELADLAGLGFILNSEFTYIAHKATYNTFIYVAHLR